MAFTVLRIQKLKTWGAVAGAGKHNQRERETPNADAERTSANQHLIGTPGMDNVAAVKEAIGSQRIRKNAVLGVEMLLSASPEYFRPHNPEKAGAYDGSRLEKWKTASMDWLNEKYGNRVVSAILHVDEATPHIHALLTPLDDKGKLNCRALFGGTRHTLSQLQTEYGNAVSSLGISRGIENSRATHQKVSRFYALTQAKDAPELQFAQSYKSATMPGVMRTDKSLKKYEHEAALNGATAQKNADAEVISVVHNKNILLTQENFRLKQSNSKLCKEKDELQKQRELLRGIDLGQVLTRLFEAKGPYRKGERQYYILPSSKEVEVTNSRWKAEDKRGGGAIDLVMHLRGYAQHNMDKAMGELACTFGKEKVIREIGAKAMSEAELTVRRAERAFTPEKNVPEQRQGQNFSR